MSERQQPLLEQAPAAPAPRFGTSVEAHALELLADVEQRIAAVAPRLRAGRRLGKQDRDELSRQLAGVVGHCEMLRAWLHAGAPR